MVSSTRDRSGSNGLNSMLKLILVSMLAAKASAWGSSSSSTSAYDPSLYGNSINREWLYDSAGMSMKLEGCVWGYVNDGEDSGCMESSSEDGTTYWYQMANCRRAQAVYSVYSSSSGHASCNSANFKETVSFFLELDKVLYAKNCAHLLTIYFLLTIYLRFLSFSKYSHSLLPKMGSLNSFTTLLTTIAAAPFLIIIMTTVVVTMMVQATVVITRTSQCVHKQMGAISVLAARMMAPFLFSTIRMLTASLLQVPLTTS
jgi:hypothetical protein